MARQDLQFDDVYGDRRRVQQQPADCLPFELNHGRSVRSEAPVEIPSLPLFVPPPGSLDHMVHSSAMERVQELSIGLSRWAEVTVHSRNAPLLGTSGLMQSDYEPA